MPRPRLGLTTTLPPLANTQVVGPGSSTYFATAEEADAVFDASWAKKDQVSIGIDIEGLKAWLRAHRTEVYLTAGALVLLAILKGLKR